MLSVWQCEPLCYDITMISVVSQDVNPRGSIPVPEDVQLGLSGREQALEGFWREWVP